MATPYRTASSHAQQKYYPRETRAQRAIRQINQRKAYEARKAAGLVPEQPATNSTPHPSTDPMSADKKAALKAALQAIKAVAA